MAGSLQWLKVLVCGGIAGASMAVAPSAAETGAWTTRGCAVEVSDRDGISAGTIAGRDRSGAGSIAKVSVGRSLDGSILLRAVAEDLDVVKKVSRNGAYTLRLERGDDLVEFRGDREGITVSRGEQSARVELDGVSEEQLGAVRMLLAGSRSVRRLRILGASLASGEMRSPGILALVLSDAVVGLLDGDVTAVQRLAERVGGRRPIIKPASLVPGCYESWEGEVIRAWDDYEACLVVHLDIALWRDACGLRWMLWAESAWFSFLTCVGSPFQD